MHRGFAAKAVVVALIAVCAWSAPMAGGGVKLMQKDGSAPAVTSSVVVGDAVAVTVANPGRLSAIVHVEVVALVDGAMVSAVQSATVDARSESVVTVEFGATVDDVISVGLIDDSGPTY